MVVLDEQIMVAICSFLLVNWKVVGRFDDQLIISHFVQVNISSRSSGVYQVDGNWKTSIIYESENYRWSTK